jgi:hypothetical protein
MDNFDGATTKGTPVDNEQRAYDAYNDAFNALYWSVNYIKQFCNELEVVYLPGNHDRLSSYHIAHALSKCFQEDRNIKFNVEYSERKVVVYGDNFFAFELTSVLLLVAVIGTVLMARRVKSSGAGK